MLGSSVGFQWVELRVFQKVPSSREGRLTLPQSPSSGCVEETVCSIKSFCLRVVTWLFLTETRYDGNKQIGTVRIIQEQTGANPEDDAPSSKHIFY